MTDLCNYENANLFLLFASLLLPYNNIVCLKRTITSEKMQPAHCRGLKFSPRASKVLQFTRYSPPAAGSSRHANQGASVYRVHIERVHWGFPSIWQLLPSIFNWRDINRHEKQASPRYRVHYTMDSVLQDFPRIWQLLPQQLPLICDLRDINRRAKQASSRYRVHNGLCTAGLLQKMQFLPQWLLNLGFT